MSKASISMGVQIEGFKPEVMAKLWGIDLYMDEYGRHRIKDVKSWEIRYFGEDLQRVQFVMQREAA